MRPILDLDTPTCKRLQGVFCDIDDTLTHEGRLVPAAFLALQHLQDAGLKVVPITGRPGGWVDQIARIWPVDGVVGENGGLWFYHHKGSLHRSYLQTETVRADNKHRLTELAGHILRMVPGCALASDQSYRDLDLAIDFCEDVPALDDAAINRIVALFEEAGCTAKVSSIHVNGWFGEFDKLTGCERFLKERYGTSLDTATEDWAYFGDSANDEPMFKAFPISVGVANVREFLPRMTSHPSFVTQGEGGHGFAEAIAHILANRAR